MQCKNCGVECAESYKFCPACGTPVNDHETGFEPVEEVVAVNSENVDIENAVSSSSEGDFTADPLQEGENVYIQPVMPAKKSKAWVFILIAVVLVISIAGVSFVGNFAGTAKLHEQLKRDWSRVESDEGTYFTVELDFSETTVDYNFDSMFDALDTTIGTFEYRVTGADTMVVVYDNGAEIEVNVEFNDDYSMMILSPAITSQETVEYWYNH